MRSLIGTLMRSGAAAARRAGLSAGGASPSQFGACALVLLAAVMCALLASRLYVRDVLAREAARESRFVNDLIRERGLGAALGRANADAEASMLAAMARPDVLAVRMFPAPSPAGTRDAEAAVARALRGEAVAATPLSLWSSPTRRPAPVEREPAVEFVVPVLGEGGMAASGAVALLRAPGPALESVGAVVTGIWVGIVGGASAFYLALTLGLRRAADAAAAAVSLLRRAVRRVCVATGQGGVQRDVRPAWRAAECALREDALRRGVHVRSMVDGVPPAVAIDAPDLARLLAAFTAHALAHAQAGDLLLLRLTALPGAVEFAYGLPGAEPAPPAGDARTEQRTRALEGAVRSAGGKMLFAVDPARGPRLRITLPA